MPDQVKGNIAKCNVLFQYGPKARPLAVSMPEDEGVVGEVKGVGY